MLPISDIFDDWTDSAIVAVKGANSLQPLFYNLKPLTNSAGLFRKGGEFEPIQQQEQEYDAHKPKGVSCSDVFEFSPKRLLARAIQVCITFSVAVAFPNLGNFVSLVGCIGFSLGGYLLPALCYYKHFKVKLPRERVGLVFMCIWSLFFVMLPGIITNTTAIIHPKGGRS